MGIFDDENLTFDCPECGHEIEKTIGEIKRTPEFPCTGCGLTIDGNDLVNGIEDVDDAVDEFRDAVDDLDDML